MIHLLFVLLVSINYVHAAEEKNCSTNNIQFVDETNLEERRALAAGNKIPLRQHKKPCKELTIQNTNNSPLWTTLDFSGSQPATPKPPLLPSRCDMLSKFITIIHPYQSLHLNLYEYDENSKIISFKEIAGNNRTNTIFYKMHANTSLSTIRLQLPTVPQWAEISIDNNTIQSRDALLLDDTEKEVALLNQTQNSLLFRLIKQDSNPLHIGQSSIETHEPKTITLLNANVPSVKIHNTFYVLTRDGLKNTELEQTLGQNQSIQITTNSIINRSIAKSAVGVSVENGLVKIILNTEDNAVIQNGDTLSIGYTNDWDNCIKIINQRGEHLAIIPDTNCVYK